MLSAMYVVKKDTQLCVSTVRDVLFICAIGNRLRGTTTGANNRMDLLSLVTSGVGDAEVKDPDEDILGVVEGWEEDESHNPDVPAVSHKRGLTPFVFIPFEEVRISIPSLILQRSHFVIWLISMLCMLQVETSVLNLPVEKMDFFVPGWLKQFFMENL